MQPRRRLLQVLIPLLACPLGASRASAHELGGGRVDVVFTDDGRYRVEVLVDPATTLQRLQLEAGEPLSFDLSPAELEAALAARCDALRAGFVVRFDVPGELATPSCTVSRREAFDGGAPLATVRLAGTVPAGAASLRFVDRLGMARYALTARHDGEERVEAHWLEPGEPSPPLAVEPPRISRLAVVRQYLPLGFTHILPLGLDHILFVLGLFLLAARTRPILEQVTAFTLAHTITLGLSIYGVVTLPSAVVEPLIALSIVAVAVENVVHQRVTPWRMLIVFGFGLLHGLGFAGALRQLGLPRGEMLTALLSFNVGVELGQLAVVLGAFLAVASWSRHRGWYRRRVVVPASLAIAAIGLYWTIERVLA